MTVSETVSVFVGQTNDLSPDRLKMISETVIVFGSNCGLITCVDDDDDDDFRDCCNIPGSGQGLPHLSGGLVCSGHTCRCQRWVNQHCQCQRWVGEPTLPVLEVGG